MNPNFHARVCTALTVAAIGLAALPGEAAQSGERILKSQDYPHRPIRIIDPFPPAGASDFIARTVGQKLTDRFGQTVVVENRAGAGGLIGAEMAAKSSPDGYTLFMVVVYSIAPSVTLYPQKLGYDITPYYGFAAPGATSPAIVRALSVEIGKILRMPEVQSGLGKIGLDATAGTPEQFTQIMRNAIAISAKIIKDANIKID